jgi:hypothetical protein
VSLRSGEIGFCVSAEFTDKGSWARVLLQQRVPSLRVFDPRTTAYRGPTTDGARSLFHRPTTCATPSLVVCRRSLLRIAYSVSI